MAILAIFHGTSIKKNDYELLRKEVNWERQKPKGMLIHTVGFDDSGLHVADVWESREALDDYFKNRLIPAMKKHNMTPPDGQFYILHNANVDSSADKYKLAA
jgi:hypothetical protein